MDINLTGSVWGWPIELIGKVSGVDFNAPDNTIMPQEITGELPLTGFESLELVERNILQEIKTFITIDIAVAISVGIIVGSAITILVIFIKDFLENRRKIQADRAKVYSRLNGEKILLMQSFKYIGNIRFIKTRNEKILELAKFRENWWKDLGLASTLFDIPKKSFLAIEISESSLMEELENNQIDHKELNKLMNNLEDDIDALLHDIRANFKYKSVFNSKEKIRWILKKSGGKIKRSKLLKYMEIDDGKLNNIMNSKDSGIQQSSSDKEMIVLVDKLQ